MELNNKICSKAHNDNECGLRFQLWLNENVCSIVFQLSCRLKISFTVHIHHIYFSNLSLVFTDKSELQHEVYVDSKITLQSQNWM